jgi:hypothetical protein
MKTCAEITVKKLNSLAKKGITHADQIMPLTADTVISFKREKKSDERVFEFEEGDKSHYEIRFIPAEYGLMMKSCKVIL